MNIKDVAKALGLSIATVSKALNDSYEISNKTKERVIKYAKENNYCPNPIAVKLRNKKTHVIGVVVSEIANNFLSQAINGIEDYAYKKGYHVIITQTYESSNRENKNIQQLSSINVDGLLISLSSSTVELEYLKELNENGMPMVFFDRVSKDICTHKVVADNYKSSFIATEHLLLQGCRNIAHITSSPNLFTTKERYQGYKDALLKHRVLPNDKMVKYCRSGGIILEEVERAINQLFQQKKVPDAILAAGDRITMTAFRALKRMNLIGQTALVGFSNSTYCDLFLPSLSVIHQPAFEMGQKATELLVSLIESKRNPSKYQSHIFETKLIVHGSSLVNRNKK